MAAAMSLVNQLLASGNYTTLLSCVKGFRNGAVYGAKVRFPHALVMTILFKSGPIKKQAEGILRATYTHSKNLASFVVIYKVLMSTLKMIEANNNKQYHSIISAFVGGYVVFGKYNGVNEQINLYLLSRILYGLTKLAADRGFIPRPRSNPFPWFAATVWAVVLWLFEHHRSHLQPSLRSSMTYLYDDSNIWHNIWDFLIYNK